MLSGADFWLPHQLGPEMQLSEGEGGLLHLEGLEIHGHVVVVDILVLALLNGNFGVVVRVA